MANDYSHKTWSTLKRVEMVAPSNEGEDIV